MATRGRRRRTQHPIVVSGDYIFAPPPAGSYLDTTDLARQYIDYKSTLGTVYARSYRGV